MSVVQKIQAAVASASNAATALALANINHDFSVVKVEAPVEYQALGNYLSEERRSNAEEGSAHITARTLGALFDGVAPATPNLLKAYGKRMSDIAVRADARSGEDEDRDDFESFAWADATSIWAAATSGPSVLQVQLLACMIVRVWKASQATTIWMEIVEGRKKEIARKYDQNELLSHRTIAVMRQQNPTRTQLAEWDASARAWLQTADRIQNRQLKQLMLILNSRFWILPSKAKSSLGGAVEAWKAALAVLESLVIGTPQNPHRHAIVLGLAAWHIYPDIIILDDPIKRVHLSDELVPSEGTLTVPPNRSIGLLASGLEVIQLHPHRRRLPEVSLALGDGRFGMALSTELCPDTQDGWPIQTMWDNAQRFDHAFLIDVSSRPTTPTDQLKPIQSDRIDDNNQARQTNRNDSPKSTTKLRTQLPHPTLSVRLICLRHVTIIGAIITLFGSLITALVLIYPVGHSISDAFTAAAWVFPAGAIFLYLLKSYLGGEVEERISPFP